MYIFWEICATTYKFAFMKGIIVAGILLLNLIFTLSLNAQIAFYNPPKDNAFIPRNVNTNKGNIKIKGNITNAAYTALTLNVYQNNVLQTSYVSSFNYSLNLTAFSHSIDLAAGKYIYTLEFILNGSSTYTKIIDGIMVGDVYLIQGQSNAVACNYVNANINYSSAYRDTFIRSFGTSYPYSLTVAADTNWYRADAENAYVQGGIGQWPLVIAKSILDSFNIPVCILNGAVGGTTITQHTSTPGNPEDLNSIYGRLLYRVKKSGLENSIRGILYFQGESDGSNANLHDSLFKQIYNSWNRDYKGFKKLYVVQVRGQGCGGPSIALRNYQRNFEFSLSKCKVISSNGLNNHDGCHYGFANGYELLGKQLAALIARDLYGSKRTTNIDPPNIKSCYYSNAAQDEVTLIMQNPNDIIYADNLFHKIFKVEGDNTVSVISGLIRNNRIVIKLSKSSCNITGITYDSDIGTQPWVKNATNAGLISFYNQPILTNQIQPFYAGCKKALITMGEDSISGCKYLWKRLSNGKTYNSAKIKIVGDTTEPFTLIITYGGSACKQKDTFGIYLSPDPVTIPELGSDQVVCWKDTLSFQPKSIGFSQFKWSSSNGTSDYLFYHRSYTTEKMVLTATSNNQCIYKDSVKITLSKPRVQLPKNMVICSNTDTLISVPDTFRSYQWNQQSGLHLYRTGIGILTVEVENKNGCKTSDTTVITGFTPLSKQFKSQAICNNELRTENKPKPVKDWYHLQVKLGPILQINPTIISHLKYPLVLIDSNNCENADTIYTTAIEAPLLNLGNDTGFCKGGSITLQLPYNMKAYFWNSALTSLTNIKINKASTYTAQVIANNNCSSIDTILIDEFALPELNNFYDTILCTGQTWTPNLNNHYKYTVNNISIQTGYKISAQGNYLIKAISQQGCLSQKNISISYKDCQITHLPSTKSTPITLYPNPVADYLTIDNPLSEPLNLIIYSLEGKVVLTSPLLNTTQSIDLSALQSGPYFVMIGSQRWSILKL